MKWFLTLFVVLFLSVSAHAQTNIPITVTTGGAGNEEFVGPFVNWINAKTGKRVDGTGSTICTGATGNGSTDDTAALQSCLNALNTTNSVLWIPAGTYKITATLTLTSGDSVSVIGADPSTTIISWGGSANSKAMLLSQGTHYSRVDRLTFNGNSNVGALIVQTQDNGAFFDTGNEYADDVFTGTGGTFNGGISVDIACGYSIGATTLTPANGCAETTVLRSQFSGGTATGRGIDMGDNNALDMWVWYSTFTGKSLPLYSNHGTLSAFHNNFINSTNTDILFNVSGVQTFSWNYSIGAANSSVGDPGVFDNTLPMVVEGNTIVNTGSYSIVSGWQGPLVVMDNTIISKAGAVAPAVKITSAVGDIFSTGNRYTIGTANTCAAGGAVQSSGRCHAVGDTVGSFTDPGAPALPATPPNNGRTIFEIVSGSSTATIQAAINSAATLGNGATVHIQAGTYSISAPLTIAGNTFLQIIGDGYNSLLSDSGAVGSGNGLIECGSSCKAIFRDFAISGNNYHPGAGIKLTGSDAAGFAGGRVFMEQPYITQNTTNGLLVNGLNYTRVELHNAVFTASASSGIKEAIKVIGAGGANLSSTNVFAGQSSDNANLFRVASNGQLTVRQLFNDIGGGTPAGASLSQASGTGGSMSLSAINAALPSSAGNYFVFTNFTGVSALLAIDGFIGQATPNEVISGTGAGASNLSDGFIGCTTGQFSDTTSPADAYEFLNGQKVAVCGNGGTTSPVTEASQNVSSLAAFLTTTLRPLRTSLPTLPGQTGDPALPSGFTDTRIYRVNIFQCINGIDVEP